MKEEPKDSLSSMTRLPYNEFTTDLENQPSMDEAWHNWLQPRWDREREVWLKRQQAEDKK